jgi:hypothetical protein
MGIIVVYSLSGSNSLVNQTMTISVRAGVASFQIPSSQIPNMERPTLQLAELLIWPQIVLIQRLCLNLSWLKPLPSSNLIVSIKEVCAGQPVVVELSGLGALTAITISILYLVQIILGFKWFL